MAELLPTIKIRTRAELVAELRVGLPVLLRVDNICDMVSNDYND